MTPGQKDHCGRLKAALADLPVYIIRGFGYAAGVFLLLKFVGV